jgi:medium-chain acyl-[acyl-carrier-protein] hydrolase
VPCERQQWIRGIGDRKSRARIRLFCLPYAGGGASVYRNFVTYFPETVEVCPIQLPGREDRLSEPLRTSVDDLVAGLIPAVAANTELPYAFFGHSMGALLAFEAIRALSSRGAPLPRHLFVSAHRAPHLPDRARLLHTLGHDEFVQGLKDYAGTPEVVFLDPELSEIFLPILRADFTVCETYTHVPARPLPVPITALGGTADPTVDAAELAAWREHTTRRFDGHLIPGDHFYLRGAEAILAHHICRETVANP